MSRAAIPLPQGIAQPFAVPARRAALEGAAVALLLVLIGAALSSPGHAAAQSYLLDWLGWLWLLWWTAWRMRPARARTRVRRFVKGLLRVCAVGALLGIFWGIVASIAWPMYLVGAGPGVGFTMRSGVPPVADAFGMAFFFFWARFALWPVVALLRRMRRRLRWQLIASHLGVIVLTFITLTGLGSIIAVNTVIQLLRPSATQAATVLSNALGSMPGVKETGRIDRVQAQNLLELVEAQRVVSLSNPGFAVAVSPLHAQMPVRIIVTDAAGRVIAAATNPSCLRSGAVLPPLPSALVTTLRQSALRGQIATRSVGRVSCPDFGTLDEAVTSAPIVDKARHTTVGTILVQASPDAVATPNQVFGATVAVFGVATVVLLMLWSVPSLLLSGLFGYLLARGLTRRIEAVSRVTTAIAQGDLSQRAPMNAQNEVGLLAASVNRMADHLQMTMGELERARERAVQSLRNRQELVASISHELRTPLAIVQAHLDSLPTHEVAPVGASATWEPEVTVPAETVRSLQNEMDRLASLVDDLFALSRAETGQLQVRKEPVDVAALVSEVATLMRPLAQREGMIALSVEAPPGLPAALADGDRLRQILSNLVRNAVRHTPDGGIIVMSVAAEGPWVVVAVADTGEGIAPEHLPHIFERFYRVDQARTRSSGGAGLGLAIVREFVELMGGKVTVESAVGEGACFRVYLPRM